MEWRYNGFISHYILLFARYTLCQNHTITFKFDFPLQQTQYICTELKKVTNSDRKSERKAEAEILQQERKKRKVSTLFRDRV